MASQTGKHLMGLRVFRRLIRLPQELSWWPVDNIVAPLWLRLQGVELGKGCLFKGVPVVHLSTRARIRLGKGVALYSRLRSNPRGLPHPTILAALGNGAAIRIGDRAAMTGVSINCRDRVEIGDWVQIGPGACLWDNDGHPLNADERRERDNRYARSAPIVVEQDAFIGARAIILKGVTIGQGAMVAAGAVVTRSVGVGEMVAGNPARPLSAHPRTREPW